MSVRKRSTYTLEYYEREYDTNHNFPLPLNPEDDPQDVYISANGLKAVLAFLVPDESPEDPFEGDEGEFYQFNGSYMHDCQRPELEDWKRIARDNPNRVVTHSGAGNCHGPGTTYCRPYTVVTPAMCRGDKRTGENSAAEVALDNCYGYYIAPADVPLDQVLNYAAGVLETYSQWRNGEVYGICVWTYERDSIADSWEEPERNECWGYYGYSGYTAKTLADEFIAASTPDEARTRGSK